MKKTILSLLISGSVVSPMALAMAPNTDLNLMPYPQTVELKSGQVKVDGNFKVYIKKNGNQYHIYRLSNQIEYFYASLSEYI